MFRREVCFFECSFYKKYKIASFKRESLYHIYMVEKEIKKVKKVAEVTKKVTKKVAEKVTSEGTEIKEDKKKVSKVSQAEYEKRILALADEGLTSEKIGEKLRGEGIHPANFKGKISKILGDKYINADLKNVEAKLEKVKAHYENNHQDKRAKREKDRLFSQLRTLKKYFGIDLTRERQKKK